MSSLPRSFDELLLRNRRDLDKLLAMRTPPDYERPAVSTTEAPGEEIAGTCEGVAFRLRLGRSATATP